MRKTFVVPAESPEVSRLKIHCWAVGSQRNVESGVRESAGRSTVVETVPVMVWMIRRLVTVPGVPIETPLTSPTRNFSGTVRRALKFRVGDVNGVSIGTPGTVTSLRIIQTITGK